MACAAAALVMYGPHSAVADDCPTLYYSTYFGGSGYENLRDVAFDGEGNMYATGGTESSDFPTTPGAYDRTFNGWHDVFVAKFDPSGALVWSTLLGGPNYDRAYAIEIGDDGAVYVGGRAGNGFPTTPGVIQETFGGDVNHNGAYGKQDGFVTKLSNDGSTVLWSTYFGTDDRSFLRDIDVDQNGDVYLGVSDLSRSLPYITPGAYQEQHGGGDDLGVAKINADGTQVIWATYCGGPGNEGYGPSVRVDDTTGIVYVVSGATSGGAPVSGNAFDPSYNGGWEMYLCKFSADGSQLLYGTYIGGSGNEGVETHNLAVDAQGHVFVGTGSDSSDYPTTSGAYQPIKHGLTDIVVSKFSADGSQLLASTFLGGASHDWAEGLAVDNTGDLLFAGGSSSDDFPITPYACQSDRAGGEDLIAVILSSDLTQLRFATFMGGSAGEGGRCVAVDAGRGRFLLGGHTPSDDWPVRNPEQSSLAGSDDGLIAAFQFDDGTNCGGHHLGAGPIVSGGRAVVEVTGATASRRQYLVYSVAGQGSTYVPQLDVTLDLANPVLAASAKADWQGTVLWILDVPSVASGQEVWLQCAERLSVTNVVGTRVE
ncbi:MAG: S-layer protein [Planctomycetes bacterium]|nr:S-layer protein [Planctomycetota bacterium]